jgi:hypothetical protein
VKKIDFEFRMIGDRQGGQHAVAYWLFHQFNGVIYWKNSGQHKHDLLKMSNFPDLKLFKQWSENTINKHTAIAVSYEDKTLEVVNTYPYPQYTEKRYDIIILRDPYNCFASKIHNWRNRCPRKAGKFEMKLNAWKQKARTVISKECSFFIDFGKWFSSKEYRQLILTWFPKDAFVFTDDHLNNIPKKAGASTWDERTFEGKAQQMDINNRYKGIIDDPLMKKIMADEEVKELSDKIFGKILE